MKRALRDIDTGKVYTIEEGEFIHSDMLERLKGLGVKHVERGFVDDDGVFYKV